MCFLHCDAPVFGGMTRPTARKAHVCCECEQKIPPGTRYVRYAGKWDDSPETFAICTRCEDVRTIIFDLEIEAGCDTEEAWCPFGELVEHLITRGLTLESILEPDAKTRYLAGEA